MSLSTMIDLVSQNAWHNDHPSAVEFIMTSCMKELCGNSNASTRGINPIQYHVVNWDLQLFSHVTINIVTSPALRIPDTCIN